MAKLEFTIAALGGSNSFRAAVVAANKEVAEAATRTMDITAKNITNRGRKDIARAGFGNKWQRTWRAIRYPEKTKLSVEPAVYARHKIDYAGVFEYGITIKGKPFLYVPTKDAPKKIGRFKTTPRRFVQKFPTFKLSSVGRFTGTTKPLLVAPYRRGRGKLKKGEQRVLFVGIRRATNKKKFNLTRIVDQARRIIPRLYALQFEKVTGQR